MELYHGRPGDVTGRTEREIRTYNLLDELGISYDRVDHEEIMTMEGLGDTATVLGAPICKNLLLCNAQKTNFYLLMMPGDKKFKTKELSKQINSARLSFAKGEYMEEYLGITPGSLSVLGLMNDHNHHVRLLIDRDLLDDEMIGMHPCMNTSTLKMRVDDLLHVFLPKVNHEPTFVTLTGE